MNTNQHVQTLVNLILSIDDKARYQTYLRVLATKYGWAKVRLWEAKAVAMSCPKRRALHSI